MSVFDKFVTYLLRHGSTRGFSPEWRF